MKKSFSGPVGRGEMMAVATLAAAHPEVDEKDGNVQE